MDPIEELKQFAEEHEEDLLTPFSERDAEIRIKPRTDGVFPKLVVIREMSSKELVLREELKKGGEIRFVPPMSGFYTLEIVPKNPEEDPQEDMSYEEFHEHIHAQD